MKRYFVLLLLLLSTYAWAGEGRILAQRVSAVGAVVGSPVTIYNSASGQQSQARVSFYDDRFLVVWQEWNGDDLDVKAARVEMDGTVLDTTPLDIASGSRTQAMPDVAADTTGWMVVWHGFPSTDVFPSLYARRVDYDGTLNTPLVFGDNNGVGSMLKIAYNVDEDRFAVVFTSKAASGVLYGPGMRHCLLSTTPTVYELSSNSIGQDRSGDSYYSIAAMPSAGWSYILHGATPNYFYRGGPGQAVVSIKTDGDIDNAGYMPTNGKVSERWSVYGSQYLDGSGSANVTTGDPYAWGPSAAVTDATYVVGVWTRFTVGGLVNSTTELVNSDLYASRINQYTRVDASGGVAISTDSGSEEGHPSLAGDGAGNLLVAYTKSTDGSSEIASRILTVGSGITPSSEAILRDDSSGARRGQSAVAYGDDEGGTTEFLVVWTEGWWGTL